MEFQVKCKCGSAISVPEEDVFKEIRCPFCGKSYLLAELDEDLYKLYYSRRKAEFEISNQTIKKYNGVGGKVLIPNDVFSVSDRSFARNGNIEYVVCPSSLKSVGNDAFASCAGLKEIDFSEGLETIGERAFVGCRSLSRINIPASVGLIGEEAFANCTGVTKLAFASGCKATIGKSAFEGLGKLSEVELRDGMRADEYAFNDCESLEKVVLGGTVTLKDNAFAGCGALTVYIAAKKGLLTPKWFNPKAFGKNVKVVWNYKE